MIKKNFYDTKEKIIEMVDAYLYASDILHFLLKEENIKIKYISENE